MGLVRRRIDRIVSGGQSGADRAGLDSAIAHGRRYGGWCPAGGWAEDFPQPPGLLRTYPGLWEAPSADPALRTYLNVRDSHATLIVAGDQTSSRGTDLTIQVAADLGRPLLRTTGEHGEVDQWLSGLGYGLTLNIAGPRESQQPGIYAITRILLERVCRAD